MSDLQIGIAGEIAADVQAGVDDVLEVTFADVIEIESTTNTSPIVVKTKQAHGLPTGANVVIDGHETNTAANGDWPITAINSVEYSLDGSVGVADGIDTGTAGAVHDFGSSTFVCEGRHDLREINPVATLAVDTTDKATGKLTFQFVAADTAALAGSTLIYLLKELTGAGKKLTPLAIRARFFGLQA